MEDWRVSAKAKKAAMYRSFLFFNASVWALGFGRGSGRGSGSGTVRLAGRIRQARPRNP